MGNAKRITLVGVEPCWVACHGASSLLQKAIKNGIPIKRRMWDNESSVWLVHFHYLHWLAQHSRRLGHAPDWSQLPERWQLIAAGAHVAADESSYVRKPTGAEFFDALYVQENAPDEVIRAAYLALVKIHHPDHGGSEEEFRRVDHAFRSIQKLRNQQR